MGSPKKRKDNYLIPLPENGKIRLICLDPGAVNSGMACIDVICEEGVIHKITILCAYRLKHPIHKPKDDLLEQQAAFSLEFRRLCKKYSPDWIVLERFLSRGRGAASTAESTNYSIGSILEIARNKKIPIKTVLAVTWKARTKRAFFYCKPSIRKEPPKNDTALDHLYRNNPKNHHIIDAFMIGIYFVDGYYYVNSGNNISKLLEGLQGC